MRWLNSVSNIMNMNLGEQGALACLDSDHSPWDHEKLDTTQLSDINNNNKEKKIHVKEKGLLKHPSSSSEAPKKYNCLKLHLERNKGQ